MNYKLSNKYFLKLSKDFIVEYSIDGDILFKEVEKYINHFYLRNKSKTYKIVLDDNILNTVVFHKLELADNNKSSKKGKRVLIFILLNKPNGINTIFPIFSFNTQEEKSIQLIYYTLKNLYINFLESLKNINDD